jgi:hypothetical protein
MLEGVIDEPSIEVFNGTNIDFHDFTMVAEISHLVLPYMSNQILLQTRDKRNCERKYENAPRHLVEYLIDNSY